MVDFVTKHVKPLEVIVHLLPAAGGCPVLEPLVFAPAELGQRLRPNLLEPAHVVMQLVPSDLTSRPLT